jgi:Thiol-activated cytolysin
VKNLRRLIDPPLQFHYSSPAVMVPILTLVGLLACSSYSSANNDHAQIERLINSINKINVANESTTPDGDILIPRHGVGFTGSGQNREQLFEQKMQLTKSLEKWVAFDPNADALYPGSLIQGISLPDGVLNPISTARTPITITVTDLVSANPTATYSATIQNPTLAKVRDATHRILSQTLRTAQPAKISFSQLSVSDIEEGLLKLGASYKWLSGSVSGSFQKNDQAYSTSVMVRIVQSYYTVSANPPSSPASFIASASRYDDFKRYVGPSNPPTYIASVTYGRELWMLLQSNHTSHDVEAALNAAYSAGVSGGSTNVNAEQKQVLNESSIQIMALGGGGEAAVQLLTGDHLSEIQNYLIAGANYSKESPGVIISYTVRYLKDNDVARVSSSIDYTIKTSQNVSATVNLSSMRVTWVTTGDNKDWNTQPIVDVYDKNGNHVGHIDCCSSDRNSDDWHQGRSETRNMQISGSPTNSDLAKGRFSFSRIPHRNDEWDYNATVEFNYADGSHGSYSCSGRNSCGTSW